MGPGENPGEQRPVLLIESRPGCVGTVSQEVCPRLITLSVLPPCVTVCKQAMKAKRAAGVAMARGKNAPKQLNTAGRVNKVSTK